ncbi:MAG: DUF3841 domain-containing protein [Roseburia sp.]|nr:DUF3841 domain-containing protein [Roseburia sp.]
MILWTIQHKAAYEDMLRTGVLRANPEYILEEFFRAPYEWMAEQMKKRIGTPPEGAELPVWAWYQWEGKRKRPDMRSHGCSSDKGVPIVLLTIDVPEECVLLSDFDYWHVVLNDGELIFPFDENAVYSKEERQESWEKIFDYECSFDDEDRCIGLSTQATLWEIKAEWVLKAEYFKTR